MADDVKYIFYCLGVDIDILEDKFAPPTPPPIVPIPNPTSKQPPMPGCHEDINDNPLYSARRTDADMQKNKFHCDFFKHTQIERYILKIYEKDLWNKYNWTNLNLAIFLYTFVLAVLFLSLIRETKHGSLHKKYMY